MSRDHEPHVNYEYPAAMASAPSTPNNPLVPDFDVRSDVKLPQRTLDYSYRSDSNAPFVHVIARGTPIKPRSIDDYDGQPSEIDLGDVASTESSRATRSSVGGMSLRTAFISLVKGNVGPGCLALPCVFGDSESVGIIVAVGILVWVSLISLYVPQLLLETQQNLRRAGKVADTYEEMAFHTFGNAGMQCVKTFLVLLQLGICTVFLNFIGDSVVVGLSVSNNILTFPECVYAVGGLALLISLGRSVKAFAIFTKLATAAMVLALLMIFGFTIKHAASHWDPTHERVRNLQYGPPKNDASKYFALTFGNLAYTSATGVGLILPLAKDLRVEDRPKYLYTTRMALGTAVAIFALLGVGCAMVFAGPAYNNNFCSSTKSITAELRHMSPAPAPNWVLAGLNGVLILAVLLTFPLQLHPAVEVLERWLGILPPGTSKPILSPVNSSGSITGMSGALSINSASRPLLISDPESVSSGAPKRLVKGSPVWWRLLRLVLVVLTATAAAFVPQLTDIISLVGCITSGALGMVFPVLMDLHVRRSLKLKIGCFRICAGVICVLSGVFAISYGNAFTMIALLNPEPVANHSSANHTLYIDADLLLF
eukprot:m.73286 g.73286  ORF g.73286 m.73286 type:complete len:597 (-) comp24543_c0_seq1:53-1843(-)